MSATTDLVLSLKDAQDATDEATATVSSELCKLHNLVWRAGKIEGPYFDQPLYAPDQAWLEDMRRQMNEALALLSELETARECFESAA